MFRPSTFLVASIVILMTTGAAHEEPGQRHHRDDSTGTWFAQAAEGVRLAREEQWAAAAAAFEATLEAHPGNAYAAGKAARSWMKAGEFEKALVAHERAAAHHFFALPGMFGAARACAALDRKDCAFDWLARLRREAWLDLSSVLDTDEFGALVSDPRYTQLVADLETAAHGPAASRSVWSPDGKQLLYHARTRRGAAPQFHITNIETNHTRQVGRFDGDIIAGFDWSPDGKWIIFARVRALPWQDNLYLMRPDGTGVKAFFSVEDDDGDGIPRPIAGRDLNPSWSHDGKRVTFVRASATEGYQIHVARADGSGLVRLTNTPHYKENARFERGDRRVCYDVPPAGEEDGESSYYIYCVSADGNGEPEVLRGDGWWYSAAWASHADVYAATYWHTNNSRFSRAVLVDRKTGELTVLTPPTIDASHAIPSRDGALVAFGASRHGFGDNRCLFVVKADGSAMRPVGPFGNCLE